MSFARQALCIALLGPLSACTFHGSFEASTSTGKPGGPAPAYDPEIASVACTDAACEERKRQAQAECDAIDRDLRERQERAERDAREQERAADEQAARERAEAEADAARRQQEAEADAARRQQDTDGRTQVQLEADKNRRDAAKRTMGQTLGRGTVREAPPASGSASTPVVSAPAAGGPQPDTAVVADSEQSKVMAQNALSQKHAEIAQANDDRKDKIRKALGRTKADMLIAAQRKRNEVHASLKAAAAHPDGAAQ